ncbi:MAG: hypothetical protein PHF67_00775 [Candidatus Nanoarchaeia archaeon]|nr:hypothetical protein [Candidatus Nanoarchaeia archaeon]
MVQLFLITDEGIGEPVRTPVDMTQTKHPLCEMFEACGYRFKQTGERCRYPQGYLNCYDAVDINYSRDFPNGA